MKKTAAFAFGIIAILFSTAQQPELFKLCPNTPAYSPAPIGSINNTLFFNVWNPNQSWDLWATNGDSGSNVVFKSFNEIGAEVWGFIPFNNMLYFFENDSALGYTMWKTDGTQAGTQMILAIGRGLTPDSYNARVLNGHFYFPVSPDLNGGGYSIWESDGTASGTHPQSSLNPDGLSKIMDYTIMGGKFFMMVAGNYGHYALWISDGADTGVSHVVIDTFYSSYTNFYAPMYTFNNLVYFFERRQSNIDTFDLWVSDGTIQGTRILQHVDFGIGTYEPEMTVYKDHLYFSGREPFNRGWHCWRTDGTTSGTTIFKTSNTGMSSMIYGYSVMDDSLYFEASDSSGALLWVSDGTTSGTSIVKTVKPYPYCGGYGNFTGFNHHLYFNAHDTATQQDELWISDGTDVGTNKVTVAIDGDSGILIPDTYFREFNGDLYFGALALINDSLIPSLWKVPGPQTSRNETGITEQNNDILKIYPNPATSTIHILSNDFARASASIEIFNNLGQSITKNKTTTGEIDISNLAAGLYLLKLDVNGAIKCGSFLKQ